jgi:hypothetical protein
MDPGTVVWLPGTGFGEGDETAACQAQYGGDYYACGDAPYDGGTIVWCCN